MKISIVVPFHFMANWSLYLERCLKSIEDQSFKDYEIILLKQGRAAKTQNSLIKMAKGELIKILHVDDCFTTKDSLQNTVDAFTTDKHWLASACYHSYNFGEPQLPHFARYSQDIHIGHNTIGSPSVIML